MAIVSSFLTFPNISWWMQVVKTDTLVLDAGEHFQKMSYRNRYRITGANNNILLTVPLVNGRNQHTPMARVLIHNEERWQVQHWRTLVSVYKRSPYFDHFEESLKPLYETPFEYLCDFNRASILWVKRQLKLGFEMNETIDFAGEFSQDIHDIRGVKRTEMELPKYYQVFEDRIGFVPDLSILDLLFSEGPVAGRRLIS